MWKKLCWIDCNIVWELHAEDPDLSLFLDDTDLSKTGVLLLRYRKQMSSFLHFKTCLVKKISQEILQQPPLFL